MTITIQAEPWERAKAEIMAYWWQHWNEIALDKETVKLDPDVRLYDDHAAAGRLHVVTVRKSGELVGYHLTLISPHLHYKSTLCGFVDIYWLRPDCRAGLTGLNLFREVENSLTKRGVRKVYSGTKKHLDAGILFERLGWTEAERLYTKTLLKD